MNEILDSNQFLSLIEDLKVAIPILVTFFGGIEICVMYFPTLSLFIGMPIIIGSSFGVAFLADRFLTKGEAING